MSRNDTHTSDTRFPAGTKDEYKELTTRLASLPEVQPPPDFTARVMARLPVRLPWPVRAKQVFQRLRSAKWTFSLTPYKWGVGFACLLAGLLIVRFTGLWTEPVPSRDPAATSFPGTGIQLGAEIPLEEGIQLLEAAQFNEARAWFTRQYEQASHEPALNYYLGRTHLALDQPGEALPFLQRSIAGGSNRAEYHFWLGLCHWALKAPDRELASYRQALTLDPGFLPAHVYSGHHYMERGQWTQALRHYRNVLDIAPDHGDALYNSGIALHHLNQEGQANETWRTYLSLYPAGLEALRVVDWLNANGDFSYRSHVLGNRRLVFKTPGFQDDACRLSAGDQPALQVIGKQVLQHMPEMDLHIVGYVDGNASLARCRVQEIKRRLLSEFEQLPADRIRLSWFGVPERISVGENKQELKQSIRIFTLPANYNSV